MSKHAFVASADTLKRVRGGLEEASAFLQSQRLPEGHWTGELSTSALSTATAVSALSQTLRADSNEAFLSDEERQKYRLLANSGCKWLLNHQNADGGFGDTNKSHSNIATTYLVLAAWRLAEYKIALGEPTRQAEAYIAKLGSWDGLRRRYGKDKTFVVPILSNCALAGMVPWSSVPHLPFEAAWLPQKYYRWAQMPVVSYAVPALVAIGQATFHHNRPFNPVTRVLRNAARLPTLRVLLSMQPDSGGYLEATPLTSFVLMNLASIGLAQHAVARSCLRFLEDSILEDGSWPIDTNLATWVTSLATLALAKAAEAGVPTMRGGDHAAEKAIQEKGDEQCRVAVAPSPLASESIDWLLRCQHLRRHPFTGADPGGWGWTDLSGAVPDSDDTPAAILALLSIGTLTETPLLADRRFRAIGAGLRWLVRLQNRDGGMPTFCKGWGKLPFDRSGTDLTAHALRAVLAARPYLHDIRRLDKATPSDRRIESFSRRSFDFLARHQLSDGAWLPLWFGNQDRSDEENPIYGTSKVLLAYAAYGRQDDAAARRGLAFLRSNQNDDGGWGGGKSVQYLANSTQSADLYSSLEETALAVEALCECGGQPATDASIMRGVDWLIKHSTPALLANSQPIGFYFAKLWYHERLYPAIFTTAALATALKRLQETV